MRLFRAAATQALDERAEVIVAPAPAPTIENTGAASPPPAPDAPPVAVLRGAVKKFGNATVIDHLTLDVPSGQIYGMIGPSGGGKTTIIRLLLGIYAPSEGEVRVFDVDPVHFKTRHRERIGYTPQGFFLYPTLTVNENLKFVARMYGVRWGDRRKRIPELLRFLELWPARNRLAKDISGGMQRRLSLACALIHRPRFLIVDEPTAGLDPVLRAKIWEHLRELRDSGVSILVTTQYIDEAAYCDTIAILNNGTVADAGTPAELRERAMGGDTIVVEAETLSREDISTLWALPEVRWVDLEGQRIARLTVEDIGTATPVVTEALQSRGVALTSVNPYVPSFDEVFMKIVGADK